MAHESAQAPELTASVIIPVYNKEDYLKDCFASLLEQTISRDALEVIFIDDGSSDGSLDILKGFVSEHPWAKIIAKENGGVSSARNAGIKAARGKYLFFLDPDDSFGPETLENVSQFFDSCYEEVDLVTYPIIPMKNDKPQSMHFRYDILCDTGVYDLTSGQNVLVCQTTMNVCVKNRFADNILFDFKPENGVEIHEDEKYSTDILLEKMKIGFCREAQYYWVKNSDSVTNNYMKPYYLYENTLGLFESYFNRYDDAVPRYLQALLLNDIGWKMNSRIFLPIHLKGAEYEAAIERLACLLDKVDDDLILSHPNVRTHHRYFLLRTKRRGLLDAHIGTKVLALSDKGEIVYANDSAEMVLLRIVVRDGRLLLVGCLKSPVFFDFCGTMELRAKRRPKDPTKAVRYETIALEESSRSYDSDMVKTNKFPGFRYECDLGLDETISFELFLDGKKIALDMLCWGRSESIYALHNTRVVDNWEVLIDEESDHISVRYLADKREIRKAERELDAQIPRLKTRIDRFLVRRLLHGKKRKNQKIWIYVDSVGKTDNAWLQFLHDSQIKDGIRRYYACHEVKPSGDVGPSGKVIAFGSRRHKMLFCNADKLICSDTAFKSFSPMPSKGFKSFTDFFNAELIYTQHGVLWAHMPWFYSYDQILFDKEVISTEFERKNLTTNYGFRNADLIPSGMPRYDFMDTHQKAKNRILLCPSWRSYLIGQLTLEGREPLEGKFLASGYYREINAFLSDERLRELLDRYDYYLDLKLHPIFEVYKHLFNVDGERISLTTSHVVETDYAMAITDYSSYSFDFVYLKRALAYFIPDADLFFGGINHYSELDMDLNEAFGPFVKSADAMIDVLEGFFANGAKPSALYQERMDGFFYHYDKDNRDRLFEYLSQDEMKDRLRG